MIHKFQHFEIKFFETFNMATSKFFEKIFLKKNYDQIGKAIMVIT